MSTEPIKIFPAGTPVRDVDVIDRGIKMHFKCSIHPEDDVATYVSKNPSHSAVFLASEGVQCPHSFRDPVWILASDYKPTRND